MSPQGDRSSFGAVDGVTVLGVADHVAVAGSVKAATRHNHFGSRFVDDDVQRWDECPSVTGRLGSRVKHGGGGVGASLGFGSRQVGHGGVVAATVAGFGPIGFPLGLNEYRRGLR